jgi:hypothetical protein
MTLFATQNKNLVFASPDGSNGSPDFRALSANDLPLTLSASSLTPPFANIPQNIDTYFTNVFFIPPNTLKNGSTFRITLFSNFAAYNSENGGATLNVRMGPNGNTLDTSIFSTNLINNPNSPNTFDAVFLITANSNTSSTTITTVPIISTAFSNTSLSTAEVDATVGNHLGVSYNSNINFGPSQIQIGLIEQVG